MAHPQRSPAEIRCTLLGVGPPEKLVLLRVRELRSVVDKVLAVMKLNSYSEGGTLAARLIFRKVDKRCEVQQSPSARARCELARGHENSPLRGPSMAQIALSLWRPCRQQLACSNQKKRGSGAAKTDPRRWVAETSGIAWLKRAFSPRALACPMSQRRLESPFAVQQGAASVDLGYSIASSSS
jgi:hypothetical protein